MQKRGPDSKARFWATILWPKIGSLLSFEGAAHLWTQMLRPVFSHDSVLPFLFKIGETTVMFLQVSVVFQPSGKGQADCSWLVTLVVVHAAWPQQDCPNSCSGFVLFLVRRVTFSAVACLRLCYARLKLTGLTLEVWWASLQRNGVSGFCDFSFRKFFVESFRFASCSVLRVKH